MNSGFISTVKLGPKGQIVIPKEVREMFGIGPGDSLILMADPERGIVLQEQSFMIKIAHSILAGNGNPLHPGESENNPQNFANAINQAEKSE